MRQFLVLPQTMTQAFHFLLLPGFSALGCMSAIEPLRVANRFQPQLYRWHLLSVDGNSVAASNGVPFAVDAAFAQIGPVSNVFVIAGFNPLGCYTRELGEWLRTQQQAGAAIGGIDTGSLVLAEAGLLAPTDAPTLHWEALAAFRERYPTLNPTDELFAIGERLMTCAGGTASIDMMLDLIGQQHGTALAAMISEQFVVDRIRQRSDHQRLEIAARYGVHNRKLIQVISLMQQHLESPLTSDALASAVNITRRQLERLFSGLLRQTPARFYMQLRLERARELVRQTEMTITAACVACGFESPSHFSRAYRQQFGCSPREDRQPV